MTICDSFGKRLTIIKGSDITFTLTFFVEETALPLDLTDTDEITVRFLNADATFLDLTLSGGEVTKVSDLGGQISVTVANAYSALLLAGYNLDFEVELVEFSNQINESKTIKQFSGVLDVISRLSS